MPYHSSGSFAGASVELPIETRSGARKRFVQFPEYEPVGLPHLHGRYDCSGDGEMLGKIYIVQLIKIFAATK